jgi:hypothetical protein
MDYGRARLRTSEWLRSAGLQAMEAARDSALVTLGARLKAEQLGRSHRLPSGAERRKPRLRPVMTTGPVGGSLGDCAHAALGSAARAGRAPG